MNKITTTQTHQDTPEPRVGQIWEDFVDGSLYLLVQSANSYALAEMKTGICFTVEWKQSISNVFGNYRDHFRLASAPITLTPNLPDT